MLSILNYLNKLYLVIKFHYLIIFNKKKIKWPNLLMNMLNQSKSIFFQVQLHQIIFQDGLKKIFIGNFNFKINYFSIIMYFRTSYGELWANV